MLLSRIKCLKTKESQPQAEVRRHSMSLEILAQPSPTVSQLLSPGPSHRPSFLTSTPGTVFWAFKTPPAWAQWPRSARPSATHHLLSPRVPFSQVDLATSSRHSPPLLPPSGTIRWTTSSSFTTGFEVDSQNPNLSGDPSEGSPGLRQPQQWSCLRGYAYQDYLGFLLLSHMHCPI